MNAAPAKGVTLSSPQYWTFPSPACFIGYTKEMTQQGSGFLCEWCAVRNCSKCTTYNLKWKRSEAKPGMAASPYRCWLGACLGHSAAGFKGWDAMEQAARDRKAAHCRTWAAKLKSGLKMQLPASQQSAPASTVATVLKGPAVLRYVFSLQSAVEQDEHTCIGSIG